MENTLIKETHQFVLDLFEKELPSTCLYHNYIHTERVLKSAREIMSSLELNDNDVLIVELSALLHDVGYTVGNENHEAESIKIATSFLTKKGVEQNIIDGVNTCINATRMVAIPNSLLEEIIRDADASHFGKKYFNEASEFLRKELEIKNIKKFTEEEWKAENIKVLTEVHTYYTDYAKEHWQPVKEKNIDKLLGKNKEKKKKKKSIENQVDVEKLKAKYKAQYKNESPERGVQTFYRVSLRNHIKLSDIADTKANILLSVNAIIISVVLGNLISKLDTNPYLIWPTAIFTVFCVISMVLSIIATRPNVTSGSFTKEDVINQRVNLSFFGNFHKMKLDEFEWAIKELVNDKDYIYKALTKDLYFLGKVLERKYRLLRITYTVFMAGIIISLISFAIAVYNNPIETKDATSKTSEVASFENFHLIQKENSLLI